MQVMTEIANHYPTLSESTAKCGEQYQKKREKKEDMGNEIL